MDVKCTYLKGYLQEEVYTKQPPCFKSQDSPNHIFKLVTQSVNGFKEAPKVWREKLIKFLLKNHFKRG